MSFANVPNIAIRNRQAIENSELCGCYHCVNVFSKHDILDWTDNDETAICPLCEVDAVIPQSSGIDIDVENLQAIHDHWFPQASDSRPLQ